MKKIIGIAITIIILIIIIFLFKNNYKKIKSGNNISNKSIDEIKEYILSIESYNANANIEVTSNKTKNIYIVEQKYIKEGNLYKQKVLEPENLSGLEFTYDGKDLSIKNSKLTLNKIYTDYKFIGSNELSLVKFIEDYSQNQDSKIYEENGKIIMEVEVKQNNIYTQNKKLYIDKENDKIDKLEIKDITQKTTIYILYNKIEINRLTKEEIIAFSNYPINTEI
jgi:hypothetical protein